MGERLTDEQMIEILAAVARLNPELIEAFAISHAAAMPRQKYLAWVQQMDAHRYRKGV